MEKRATVSAVSRPQAQVKRDGEEQLGQRFPLKISIALNGVGVMSRYQLNGERNVRLLRNSPGSRNALSTPLLVTFAAMLSTLGRRKGEWLIGLGNMYTPSPLIQELVPYPVILTFLAIPGIT